MLLWKYSSDEGKLRRPTLYLSGVSPARRAWPELTKLYDAHATDMHAIEHHPLTRARTALTPPDHGRAPSFNARGEFIKYRSRIRQ